MLKEPSFKTEDVWTVARALVDEALTHEDGDHFIGFRCQHCRAELPTPYKNGSMLPYNLDHLRHGTNCPVLVARDLLVGAPATT